MIGPEIHFNVQIQGPPLYTEKYTVAQIIMKRVIVLFEEAPFYYNFKNTAQIFVETYGGKTKMSQKPILYTLTFKRDILQIMENQTEVVFMLYVNNYACFTSATPMMRARASITSGVMV